MDKASLDEALKSLVARHGIKVVKRRLALVGGGRRGPKRRQEGLREAYLFAARLELDTGKRVTKTGLAKLVAGQLRQHQYRAGIKRGERADTRRGDWLRELSKLYVLMTEWPAATAVLKLRSEIWVKAEPIAMALVEPFDVAAQLKVSVPDRILELPLVQALRPVVDLLKEHDARDTAKPLPRGLLDSSDVELLRRRGRQISGGN